MNKQAKTGREVALLTALVILAAATMRVPLGGVGPLVGDIRAQLGLSAGAAGYLTTIPLIIFALTAPVAGKMTARWDSRAILCACMVLCGAGLVLRSYGGAVGLFGGTALIGLSIGVLNVLMPALIREKFTRVGMVMGLYSAVMTAASALASGTSRGLALWLGSWRESMAVFLVFPLAALVLCLAMKGEAVTLRSSGQEPGGGLGAVGSRKNWAIALYLGLQSLLFFTLLAWYPAMVEGSLADAPDTGLLLLFMQVVSLPPALLAPELANRARSRGLLTCLAALLLTAGLAMLTLLPFTTGMVVGATVLLGLGSGATLSISLTLMALQGSTAAESARSAAFIQCVSYLLAAFGPATLGGLYDSLGQWPVVLAVMTGLSLVMAFVGLYAGKREEQG